MTVPMILCVKTRSLASNQILSRSQRNSKTSLRRRTFPTGQMRKSSVEVATIFTMLLLLLLLLVERKYTHSWQSLSLHPARKRLPVRSNHASPSEIVLRTQHHLHDFGTSNSEPLDSTRTTALSSTTAGISSTTSSSARMPGHPLQTSPTYDNGDAVSLHLRGEEIDLRSGAPTVFGQETCHGDYRTETNDDNDSLRPAQFQMPSAETNDSSAQNMESIVNRDVHFGIDYKTATTISPSVGRMDLTAEAAVSSVLNSVSHWCDIMRQKGSWLPSDTSNEDNKADGDKRDDNSTNQNLGGSSHTSTTLGLRLDSVLSDPDMSSIEGYWDCIMPTVSYLGTVQVSKIYKALCVAYQAHRGQIRKSGEPFIVHPVEVALLLSGLKMDAETVMAGLLHDTVEDTELTFAQVESLFGVTVRSIVEGETKVSKLPKQLAFSEYADEQAENLRQMFVAMTDDYRIIIVKLADRLHNMRTLKYMKPEKQIMISRETLDIFAPLAHRMGIWQFKSELEDTAFMYLYPVEYKRLDRRLQQHHKKFKDTLDKSQELLQRRLNNDPTLKQQAAKVEVFGRRKEIYSLWHKMETKKEHNLENILDVVALRVIITPLSPKSDDPENDTDRGVWLCYHVLGLVQHLHGFQPVPTKVKDYISFPKPNGYQSLHTALILDGQSVEVQIRTRMMHQVAEYGMASHWAYTNSKRLKSTSERGDDLYKTPWLSSIKEWQNDRISSRDFVDSVRRELLGKRVFVFLRNGKILNLARGATAIDAAFQIHTEIGLTMHGVEVNGKPVPFSYELCNGDVVSILTGKGKPATDWMRYAKSRSTRSKLRAYFRARQKESLREAGKMVMLDYLWIHKLLIEEESFLDKDFTVPTLNIEELHPFLTKTSFNELDDLLIELGKNHDRNMLHKCVSQMFEVPRKLLIEAEEKINQRYIGGGLGSSLYRDSELSTSDINDHHASKLRVSGSPSAKRTDRYFVDDSENLEETRTPSYLFTVDKLLSKIDAPTEFADPEHLCKVCLPVHGDVIVGTRRPNLDPSATIPTVHRMGCPHSQEAINRAWAVQRQAPKTEPTSNPPSIWNNGHRVDSFTLRQQNWTGSRWDQGIHEYPVKLEWSDLDVNNTLFLSEVLVVADDRRLLLADCSEVVSETVEIVKSVSSTTDEHASLVFLVQVTGLDHIQKLMNRLLKVRSVMSVERRFGSELLF